MVGVTPAVQENSATIRSVSLAEHPVLIGRHQLCVQAAHGPGAAAHNVRERY